MDNRIYQWDIGRKIKVDESVQEVHFAIDSNHALVTQPVDCIASIPNVLLQSGNDVMVYMVIDDQTIKHAKIRVIKRAKPDDYVFTEDEVFTYKALEERIASLEKGETGGTGGSSIDVQINGTSIVKDGVANIPKATKDVAGVVKVETNTNRPVYIDSDGLLQIARVAGSDLDNRNQQKLISGAMYDHAVRKAMCDGKGAEWTDEEKQNARERMGIEWKLLGDVTVEEDGVKEIEILIDNPNYNEYQFYVKVADRKTPTAQNMIVGFNGLTSTSYALTYVGVGTNTTYFMRGQTWRNCNSGWLTLCMGSKDGKPYTQSHIRACDYYSREVNSEVISTEKPQSINVNLSTGFDIGSIFIVYAR